MSKNKSKYTKEVLEPIVRTSLSYAQVIKSLGLKLTGGNYRHISSRIKYLEIDTAHFKGGAWSKGLTAQTSESIKRISNKRKWTSEELFVENSPPISSSILRRHFKEISKYECSECRLDTWLNKPITLHLDHVNGIRNDNRIENLRWLCPNCHQQTETWGNKNRADVVELADTPELDSGVRKSVRVQLSPSAPKTCLDCSATISRKAQRCKSCVAKIKNKTKIEWPSTEELIERLKKSNYTKLAQELGVSDNAIRKRIKNYS